MTCTWDSGRTIQVTSKPNESYVRDYPTSPWVTCPHESWRESREDHDYFYPQVECTKCGVPGEIYVNGEIYWPTT